MAQSSEREVQRLTTLNRYQILNTAEEPAFDDLAALAAHICGTPIALVSFVDERRQWIKARQGTAMKEIPREVAFCAHTVLHDAPLEVPDTQLDERFRGNPLVVHSPHIRYYAGVPLITPDGFALGTLCVIDHSPRKLSPGQIQALAALSRKAVAELELRVLRRELGGEIADRRRAEQRLQHQVDQVKSSEQSAQRLLEVTEKSRRALLSVLEDEKRSGQRLRESEERFRQLAENINEVFWMTDPRTGAMLYVSPAYQAIWGRTCERLYEQPAEWYEAIHPEDSARVMEAALRQEVGDYHEVFRIVRPSGSIRWVRDRAFPVRNDKGEVYRMVGTAEDITETKRAELRADLEHEVTSILSQAAALPETARRLLEIVCRRLEWDVGHLWAVNRATGNLRDLASWERNGDEASAFRQISRDRVFALGEDLPGRVWSSGEPMWLSDLRRENWFRRGQEAAQVDLKGALAFPIKLRSEIFGVIELFSREVRHPDPDMLAMFAALGSQIGQFIERKELEDQFRQAQKMEAIGTLAGGIAHDFNNVLAAINGYTELAKMDLGNDALVSQYLDAVLQGGRRATDLVRQILAFSRRQELERRSLDLSVTVEEALKLLRATIPATIEFAVALAPDLSRVLADATQIHQVVMNLCTNAAHAMRERAGRLTIELDRFLVRATEMPTPGGINEGEYVRLSITDTGHGMDQPTISRIFEPFFTTKGPGEGTGLGLAVVHGIMRSHDGAVTVYSHLGEGTTFRLYFPVYAKTDASNESVAEDAPRGRGERILYVDDEDLLATMGKRILERLGYLVSPHTNAMEALESLRANPSAFDLVITDQMMPGMSGTAFAEQIQTIRSDLPIILTTGYTASLMSEQVMSIGIRKILTKPISHEVLSAAVYSALNSGEKADRD
ncbi:MAG: ATP-binding protein [Opitutus sp.]